LTFPNKESSSLQIRKGGADWMEENKKHFFTKQIPDFYIPQRLEKRKKK
jgi:hypothetical protein